MSQIGFISNQHDDDIGIGVISKFFEPTNDVFVSDVFGDVIHK